MARLCLHALLASDDRRRGALGQALRARPHRAAAGELKAPTVSIDSYPTEPGFIRASVELVKQGLAEAKGATRVLFSAHGLPEKTIKAGDPYQSQVEQTAAA